MRAPSHLLATGRRHAAAFMASTEGVTAIEYGLIGVLILVVCTAGITAMVNAMPVPFLALADALNGVIP